LRLALALEKSLAWIFILLPHLEELVQLSKA
jgi:hypothetical protein